MTASFDENNPKYWVLFKKLHIRSAARGVSIISIVLICIDLIQSFARTTSIMFYSWLAACFAIAIYGTLTYAVFKEKRKYLFPYLSFQSVLLGMFTLILLFFIISSLFSPSSIRKLGIELGSVNEKAPQKEQDNQLRGFVVWFFIVISLTTAIQLWFLEIIYRFFHFLKDRETSFNFNLENEFQMDG